MPPEGSFARCFLRRLQCATLVFLFLIVGAYGAASLYYVVRVSVIENPHLFDDMSIRAKDFAQRWVPWAVPMCEHLAARYGTAGGDSTSPLASFRVSSHTPYTQTYKVLRVGEPMSRQRVRNPVLPAGVPIRDDSEEFVSADGTESARNAVPSRQRYVLDGLRPGTNYMIRLSFLGLPSAGFDLFLYQARLSSVRKSLTGTINVGGATSPTTRGWAEEPQDTERLVFSTSRDNALQFSVENDVWIEREETDGRAGDSEGDTATIRGVLRAASGTDDPFVPVVEVSPRTLSIPVDAYRVPIILFNIQLDPLSSAFLPQMVLPLTTYSAWVLVFVGYLVIYTLVSRGIAGGEDVKQKLD